MDELVEHPLLRLSPELVDEVLVRLPPEEPACFVRASAVCKPWRLILADPGFRRRYREFHGTPPVLGFFQKDVSFFPTSALPPAQPNDPRWVPLDCRHGRALFAFAPAIFAFDPAYRNVVEGQTVGLIIWDPLTGHGRRLPSPPGDSELQFTFSAAVFCAAQGCDHHGCQGGHYRVIIVTTNKRQNVTSGRMYSSETRVWGKLTSIHHPSVEYTYTYNLAAPSVIVGDALYFNIGSILKCQLGTLRLSMFEKPIDGNGRLMTAEDGKLGFVAVVDVTDLTLWSMQTGPEGATGWVKLRAIDLNRLLPNGALPVPTCEFGIRRWVRGMLVSGVAEGTQVIFVKTQVGSYMVDLKAGRARKVSRLGRKIFPYMSFYIPAMEAACSTVQGQ
ncbi:hypothetical protein VPH35_093320 [Triticum aestivum]|uniref:F-box domain-containing protein n=1 Tax=Triticum turgidum subsp. durum TaxID=4567 RepID=A0A9R1ASC8_TRITD|nr:uncharacterized protein LOC123117284 [Triticum aestivum]VAI38422.1 unnamed protein product [Triticum turgidum subsp. durum]